jgi:hypothetical protein
LLPGDALASGCCANAAPESASEQPISNAVNFFIRCNWSLDGCDLFNATKPSRSVSASIA